MAKNKDLLLQELLFKRLKLFNLKDEYNILIIAHRLSTIVNCDKIMLLENGKIADEGTHEELLNRNNTYQTLYRTEIIGEY